MLAQYLSHQASERTALDLFIGEEDIWSTYPTLEFGFDCVLGDDPAHVLGNEELDDYIEDAYFGRLDGEHATIDPSTFPDRTIYGEYDMGTMGWSWSEGLEDWPFFKNRGLPQCFWISAAVGRVAQYLLRHRPLRGRLGRVVRMAPEPNAPNHPQQTSQDED